MSLNVNVNKVRPQCLTFYLITKHYIMVRNIKELSLEVIELEDQILLVDENKPRVYGDYYLLKNAWGLDKHEITKWTESKHSILSGKKSKPTGVIIASTKQLEGLPLLVIEDDVEMSAEKYSTRFQLYGGETDKALKEVSVLSYLKGYKKAKETYKFTEEDLRNALSESFKASQEGYQITSDEIIQSLTKKELYVEVEMKETKSSVFRENDNAPFGKYQLKIRDNKIKAVWK